MMTRDDMMRELELLPVWQQRAPLPSTDVAVAPQKIAAEVISKATKTLAEANVATTQVEQVEQQLAKQENAEPASLSELAFTEEQVASIEPQHIAIPAFCQILSEDGQWLFVMENAVLSGDEQLLFQNMCKALRIKTKQAEVSSTIQIANTAVKLLLVMGESAAQAILQTIEPIADLRAKLHVHNGASLIATYDLAHLLEHRADKAKVWQDLCLGMQFLQDLSSVNGKER